MLTYLDLARHLGPTNPSTGFRRAGLDGKQAPHTNLEETARDYIAEIRQFQPEGPYYLGGTSFGGMIAFEMAQQLVAQGQTVGVLALFDTYGPGYPRYMTGISPFRMRLPTALSNEWTFTLATFLLPKEYCRQTILPQSKSTRLQHRGRVNLKRFKKNVVVPSSSLPGTLRKVEQASRRATTRRSPTPAV